ncbi:hypothetical protein AV274_3768 [Blastocystis sp. ATCC 50177/Nand II]|uniref:Uncharacterized protein n=1 Tax=Blastocystis sp. subtype 1 (strain ATCC 50177 / NandII) TaxID=478820 RepID=A0A196SBN3_BLAHN|nr:hypothetical protein AV274_3768 [Blastocystis sp. ATCC 50177/Nand II]
MSARQLARLRALVEEKKRQEEEATNEAEEEDEEVEEKPHVSFSAFDISDDDDDSESESTEEEEETSSEEEESAPAESKEEKPVDDMAYLDQIIAESGHEQKEERKATRVGDSMYVDLGEVLSINTKKLNDEEESNAKFGVNEANDAGGRGQRARQRQQRRLAGTPQSSLFVIPSPSNVRPPSIVGGGYSIDIVDAPFNFDKGSLVHLDNQATFYSLNMSKEYEHLMEEYQTYKSGYISQDMTQLAFEFYRKHPYSLQVSFDICKMMVMYKDSDQILFFLRQCLFLIEKAAGIRFKWGSGNMRVLYSEDNNKILFDVFALYVHMAIRKACYETALNSSLLLFSFFPQGDPTGQLLLIPYLALTTHHYTLIEQMMESGLAIGTLLLGMLPNWSFDYGLALYRQNKEGAREQIKSSLRRWPQVLRMLAEMAKVSLFVPSEMKESAFYNHRSDVDVVEMMVEVFVHREVQLWSSSEIWTLMTECYRDMMSEGTAAEFEEEQEELKGQYEAAADFFNTVSATTGIEDFLFTVDPNNFTDDLPEYNIDDIVAGAQRQQLEAQLEEQLNGLRVNHNVPVDHDLFRLFFEALNPNMNVNELNDDDVAALQEQMNEILDGGHLPDQEGEGEWQQDWNSDEE